MLIEDRNKADMSEVSSTLESHAGEIAPASHLQEMEELQLLPEPLVLPMAEAELLLAPAQLELQEVLHSVQMSYPKVLSAILERQIADGKQASAAGEFDLKVKGFGIAAPMGYYKTYRNGISLEQPLYGGGYAYGGYKIGDGNFEPWYGERATNEGGEFALGLGTPLLQGRTIDKRREALLKSTVARQAVEPAIQAQVLEVVRLASINYWYWVAAGQAVDAQRALLELAQHRVNQIEERVKAGDLPQIVRINNDQLIASREAKVIQSERKLQQAAIKLSLYLRRDDGEPIIPAESQLPRLFPASSLPDSNELASDIAQAVAASPELRELNMQAQQLRIELARAENMLLPQLDASILAKKDVGAAASPKGDKTPFQLEAGLYGEIPLQRRKARGMIESVQGKLTQNEIKRQFAVNRVTAAVQDAVSALQASAERIKRANTNLRLAAQTLDLGREQFNAGDIDLISLNIYEQSATDARFLLIEAQADYFAAMADYRAALSIAPPGSRR
ncbi:TolC family protein [Blastopirellula sp. J2-11]|uniref:TolC family protein n=1 Tax=Blastopirellula sp. J2-11 TaxID=2943192 RepID=UPI0021CAD885|nr:TolC family protein [Blastopirellula sp. J2-11]UUO04870.1 TolC family protein [Blastopirellula sp. J2-11]